VAKQQKWIRVAPCIRCRLHPTRKHGLKPDKYFVLRYSVHGEKKQEALGWASEGWSLDKAQAELVRVKESARTGNGPITLAEKRQHAEEQRRLDQLESKAKAIQYFRFCDYWVDSYFPHAQRTKQKNSWIKEEQHFRNWLKPTFGPLPLKDIGLTQWDTLMTTLEKAGLSQRSKEYITGTARRVFRHAQDRGLPVQIPTGKQLGATAPKDNRRVRVITKSEIKKILEALEKRDLRAWWLVRFAFLTGCRLSEATRLKWAHIDEEDGTLFFIDTKNKDSRKLPLTPALNQLFSDIRQYKDDTFVFVNNRKQAYGGSPNAFIKIVEEMGLNRGRSQRERITFHSIRHTVATELAKRLSLRELMDTMGWKSVSMAARYVHTDQDNQKSAMAGLENMLSPIPAPVIPIKKRKKRELQ
jgi:integrase